MTTIVATTERMAADSGVVTSSGVFCSDKLLRTKQGIVGAAGYSAHCSMVIDWLDGKRKKPKLPKTSDFAALYLTRAGLFYLEYDLAINPVHNGMFAIGSGAAFALGSLLRDVHCGREPDLIGAVEVACLQDPLSHGPVSFLTLGSQSHE